MIDSSSNFSCKHLLMLVLHNKIILAVGQKFMEVQNLSLEASCNFKVSKTMISQNFSGFGKMSKEFSIRKTTTVSITSDVSTNSIKTQPTYILHSPHTTPVSLNYGICMTRFNFCHSSQYCKISIVTLH